MEIFQLIYKYFFIVLVFFLSISCCFAVSNDSYVNDDALNSSDDYIFDDSALVDENISSVDNMGNGLYKGRLATPLDENNTIDNKAPLVWSNYLSDLYDSPFYVNLSSWDNVDENPLIYYTLDGSNPKDNGILYQNPILISNTTTLKYYSKDSTNHSTNLSVCNYIFECVGNLNTGKGYVTIQSAIDDLTTVNGDIILVKSGIYNVNIILNKSLNLIGKNAILTALITSYSVIDVDINGSGSLISGFNIINSEQGININGASNVSIINNSFCNVLNSINVNLDNNTVISENIINDVNYYNTKSNVGIKVNKSKNLLITKNSITLNSNSGYAIRIINDNCKNAYIVNNTLRNKKNCKGYGISVRGSGNEIASNHISNFRGGIYELARQSIFYNNIITSNKYGINMAKSINNTYKSNNFYNNIYGVFLSSTSVSDNDSFYLNRLCNNSYYDFCSEANCSYIVNDNWWGEYPPKISTNTSIYANIYNGTGSFVLNSWIVMKLGACSYKIDENASIERAKFYVDMTYNNKGECLSYKGFLPDGLEVFIACFNSNLNSINNISYLKDGLGFVDFELSDLFNNVNFIYVYARMDYSNLTYTFNKRANIDIAVSSSAWDIDTNYFVNYYTNINFTEDTYWITVSWSETGLYTGVINIIVNGEIIESINITNYYYQYLKNSYSSAFFEAMKFYNEVFASTRQGVWEPNYYYFSFANTFNLDFYNPSQVSEVLLWYIQIVYNLTDNETNLIRTYHNLFVDFVEIGIDYHGDKAPNINLDYNGEYRYLDLPSEYVHRLSNIYYSNIEDEYGASIGYEGMRSFAITKSKLTNSSLSYWLNQKSLYPQGLMKAAYGTFLTAFLVIWENDCVANDAALKFNVTWSRICPVCVSLCNDYNCLYITGESDHGMGREAIGNVTNIWKFNFATSYSFSLIEQLVGNNVWNDTTVGSVTLGLIQSYLNNETLEIFTSNGYIFIKRLDDNSTLLFLDTLSGIVRDEFSYYGLLGTMPCYHDNITEMAWRYGNSLLNPNSKEYKDLMNISTAATNNLILNEFTEMFAFLFQNFDSIEFIDNLIIGILGEKIVSVSVVVFTIAVSSTNPELIATAFITYLIGEFFIAYSDGMLNNPNIIDWGFFIADSILAIADPIPGGSLKVGSQTLKVIIEKTTLKMSNYESHSSRIIFNLDYVEWDLGKIIFENVFNKPANEYILDFINDFGLSSLHEVFSNIFDYYFAEA